MMFRFSCYLDRHLHGHVDFSSFHLLAIIPRKKKPAVILLAPKDGRNHTYFNLQYGEFSLWYGTLEDMLSAAKTVCGLTKYQLWQCRRRYRTIQRRKSK